MLGLIASFALLAALAALAQPRLRRFVLRKGRLARVIAVSVGVYAVVGMILVAVDAAVMARIETGREEEACIQVRELAKTMQTSIREGRAASTGNALADPWGNRYEIAGRAEIRSMGRDGKRETPDDVVALVTTSSIHLAGCGGT